MEVAHLKELGMFRAQLEAAPEKVVEDFKKSAECRGMVFDASANQYEAGFYRAVRRGRKAGLDMTPVTFLYEDEKARDSENEGEGTEDAARSDQLPPTFQPDSGSKQEEGPVPDAAA